MISMLKEIKTGPLIVLLLAVGAGVALVVQAATTGGQWATDNNDSFLKDNSVLALRLTRDCRMCVVSAFWFAAATGCFSSRWALMESQSGLFIIVLWGLGAGFCIAYPALWRNTELKEELTLAFPPNGDVPFESQDVTRRNIVQTTSVLQVLMGGLVVYYMLKTNSWAVQAMERFRNRRNAQVQPQAQPQPTAPQKLIDTNPFAGNKHRDPNGPRYGYFGVQPSSLFMKSVSASAYESIPMLRMPVP
jgi:hypothetical protein